MSFGWGDALKYSNIITAGTDLTQRGYRAARNKWGGDPNEAAAQQEAAQEEALRVAQDEAGLSRERSDAAVQQGRQDITSGAAGAIGALGQAGQIGLGYYQQGMDRGAGALSGGYGQAQSQLSQLQGQAGPQAYDAMGQYGGTLESMRGGIEGMHGAAMQDPGAAFREKSAMDALSRRQAASGGRMSGRAMSELAQLSSGLASQEYGAAYGRAAQQQQMRQQVGGMELSALQNQAGRSDAMAQYGRNRLDAIGGQQAQMAATEGSELARLYGQNYGQMASLGANTAGAIASTQMGAGQSLANLGMQGAQQYGQMAPLVVGAQNNAAQYAGMQEQMGANRFDQLVGLAGTAIGGLYGGPTGAAAGGALANYYTGTGGGFTSP